MPIQTSTPNFLAHGFHRRRGFSLIELTTVLGIVVTLVGMSLSGLGSAMRRGSTSSGSAILAGMVDGCGKAAETASSTGRIHGFSIEYQGTSQPCYIIPWYIDPVRTDGTIAPSAAVQTYDSAAHLRELCTLGDEPVEITSRPGVYGYALPMTGVVGSYFTASQSKNFFQKKIGSSSTTLATGNDIHVCFEPGNGLIRAAFITPFGRYRDMFPGITDLRTLANTTVGPVELNLHKKTETGTLRIDRRFVITMNGATEVKGPRG